MADGDMPLVKSYRGNEFEFGAVPNGNGNGNATPNGMKNGKNNSRMSTLLFWQGRKGANGTTQNGKNWIHSQDALVNGHVAYLVKFLGCTAVDQPKGIEVVKDAITKLHFTQQLKKSETKEAAKCKKVEITISVDGVAIQEPKSTNIMYQFPLHRISYCADDKGAKKYFSFIAKGSNASNGGLNDSYESADEKHQCFVFISTKLASEITLTIGQAFDLAYRRFLEDNGKYFEMQKLTLENKKLELQMNTYKNRLQELSKITYKDDLQSYLSRNNIAEVAEFKVPEELQRQISALTIANGITGTPVNGVKADIAQDAQSNKSSSTQASADLLLSTPPPPSGRREKQPVVGTKLEGLLLNSDDDSDFDPRAEEESRPPTVSPPLLAPPPKATRRTSSNLQQPQPQQQQQPAVNGRDLFGSTPFPVPSTIQPQNYATTHQYNTQTHTNLPNYDIIRDFKIETSVFNNKVTNDARSTSFTNLTGYDPFETQNGGNIFGNGYGNAFNGFGNLSEKPAVELDSNFNGFLDKRISEMKDGFSRGISFGNDNFSIDNLDPLKKN